MKKLLLLSAIAFAAFSANAQITVTVMGEPVKNGSTIDVQCLEVDSYSQEIAPGVIINSINYTVDPEVFATVSVTGKYSISVTNTSKSIAPNQPNVQFCWPFTCEPVRIGATLTNEGQLNANEPSPLRIDALWNWDDYQGGFKLESVLVLSCDLKIMEVGNSSNSFSCSINMIADPVDAAVDEVTVDNDAPKTYYDLAGRRVLSPAKGQLVIERQGSKARKVVI